MTTIRLLSEENFRRCENDVVGVLDKLFNYNQKKNVITCENEAVTVLNKLF